VARVEFVGVIGRIIVMHSAAGGVCPQIVAGTESHFRSMGRSHALPPGLPPGPLLIGLRLSR